MSLVHRPSWVALFSFYPSEVFGAVHGGLIVYYRSTLQPLVIQHNKSEWKPYICIKIRDVVLSFTYLPPENSAYIHRWDTEPIEFLFASTERIRRSYPTTPFLIFGDLNARRNLPPSDHAWNDRGRLLNALTPVNWNIHAPTRTFVSHNLAGSSCVDYIILSPEATPRSTTYTGVVIPFFSDHAPVAAILQMHDDPHHEIVPLPHDRPPTKRGVKLIDIQEQNLVLALPKQRPQPTLQPTTVDTTPTHKARSALHRILVQMQTTPHLVTQAVRDRARAARNQLKAERRRAHRRKADLRAQHLASLPPKDWWAAVMSSLKGASNQEIPISGPELVEHFTSLLHKGEASPIPASDTYNVPHPTFCQPFTIEEVETCVAKLKNSTSGEDQITTDQIKSINTHDLCAHLNNVILTGEVPDSWKRSILVAIPKPGADPSAPDNVRGIAIQARMRKLFTLLLTQRVQEYAERHNIIPPYQNGFRPNHRTADNVYILRALHESALHHNSHLYTAQIDIRKAFDSVSRPLLFSRLYQEGSFPRSQSSSLTTQASMAH